MFDISKDSRSYLDSVIKKKKSLVASKGKANKTDCAKLLQSCPTLCDSMDLACQALLSMGFSRQVYWSGLPFPTPGDLPNPGIEPTSLMSPANAGDIRDVGSIPGLGRSQVSHIAGGFFTS